MIIIEQTKGDFSVNIDILSTKKAPRHTALKLSVVNKNSLEYASTEEALTSANKIMNIYDEAFRELAK